MTETAPDVGEPEGNIPSFRYHHLVTCFPARSMSFTWR